MQNRRGLARRVYQANRLGVPSIIAGIGQLLSSSTDSLLPHTLIAVGDVLRQEDHAHLRSFTTWMARPLIAEVMARSWSIKYGTNDENVILARIYGDLAAISSARNHTTLADCMASRAHILSVLRHNTQHPNEMRGLVTDIVRKCRAAGAQRIAAVDCRGIIEPPVDISHQTYIFYEMRGHVIPDTLFAAEETRVLWANLRNPNVDLVELENLNPDLVPNYDEIWSTGSDDMILGYFEAKARQNPDKSRALFASAIFCFLTAISKQSSITQAWVTRRRRMFQENLPGVNLDEHINDTIVKHYNRFYINHDITANEVYKQLVTCWSMLQGPEGLPLTWILEQSANNHVTSLTTIADVVTKLRYFDTELLINKGIPQSNFEQAMTLALDLMRNAFSSVVKPTVNIRKYADLAYMCTYMKKELIKDEAFTGYRGQAATMCSLPPDDLHRIARALHDISRARMNEGLEVNNLYMNRAGGNIREIGGELFRLPRILVNVEGAARADDGAGARRGGDELLREARHGWPVAARNLPVGTERVTPNEVFNALDEALDEKARAFKLVMSRLYAMQAQVPLTLIPENSITVPSADKQIPADVNAAMDRWGIVVPPAWLEPTAVYVAAADDGIMNDAAIVQPARPAWQPQGIAGALNIDAAFLDQED